MIGTKIKRFEIRLSQEQKDNIERKSRDFGFTNVSEYARTVLQYGPKITKQEYNTDELMALAKEIADIKKSLQWIANRCANTGSIYYDDIIELRDIVNTIQRKTERYTIKTIEDLKRSKYSECNK